MKSNIPRTGEQHSFELRGSAFSWMVFAAQHSAHSPRLDAFAEAGPCVLTADWRVLLGFPTVRRVAQQPPTYTTSRPEPCIVQDSTVLVKLLRRNILALNSSLEQFSSIYQLQIKCVCTPQFHNPPPDFTSKFRSTYPGIS